METIHRLSHCFFTISAVRSSHTFRFSQLPPAVSLKNPFELPARSPAPKLRRRFSNGAVDFRAPLRVSAGWFSGLGAKKKAVLPDIVKAGDPVLNEPASEVPVEEIGSERIQKIIDDMIGVMRKFPGIGLAAPQIGIPLKLWNMRPYLSNWNSLDQKDMQYRGRCTLEAPQIIVLEDTKDYISYAPKNEIEAQDRRPFDLLVILNPKMKKKSNKTALFFEGCLSVDGFRAVVERYLEVEVSGLSRDGHPIRIDATGWQARILQHECDHLDGTLYVDKMVLRTFRTLENLDLPLPVGCPQLGVR